MDFDHKDKQRLEQLVQQTRWSEVADARQRVIDRLEAIDRMQFEGNRQLSRDHISILQQRAVQLYIEQVETVLAPVNGRVSEWWDTMPIGAFSLPNDETTELIGLEEYVDLPETIPYTAREFVKPHGGHMGEYREVARSYTPPVGIHRNAFRATNRALADKGIEFDPRDKDVGEDQMGPENAVGP
jgi:hypothetical protein|uniref:Uncharacterized protein n=1 Tax=uncultured virus TaxID=340016 RepID=D5L2B3_9VIRU|nr:hypothetical protein [uncultured virus]